MRKLPGLELRDGEIYGALGLKGADDGSTIENAARAAKLDEAIRKETIDLLSTAASVRFEKQLLERSDFRF